MNADPNPKVVYLAHRCTLLAPSATNMYHTQRRYVLLAATVVMMLALFGNGCGQQNGGIGSFGNNDPRASFESFMKSYLANLQLAMDEETKEKEAGGAEYIKKYKIIESATRYDVQKSASIVLPYEGILTITSSELYRFPKSGNGEWEKKPVVVTRVLKFGFQDGKWVPAVIIYSDDVAPTTFDSEQTCFWKAYERTRQ